MEEQGKSAQTKFELLENFSKLSGDYHRPPGTCGRLALGMKGKQQIYGEDRKMHKLNGALIK